MAMAAQWSFTSIRANDTAPTDGFARVQKTASSWSATAKIVVASLALCLVIGLSVGLPLAITASLPLVSMPPPSMPPPSSPSSVLPTESVVRLYVAPFRDSTSVRRSLQAQDYTFSAVMCDGVDISEEVELDAVVGIGVLPRCSPVKSSETFEEFEMRRALWDKNMDMMVEHWENLGVLDACMYTPYGTDHSNATFESNYILTSLEPPPPRFTFRPIDVLRGCTNVEQYSSKDHYSCGLQQMTINMKEKTPPPDADPNNPYPGAWSQDDVDIFPALSEFLKSNKRTGNIKMRFEGKGSARRGAENNCTVDYVLKMSNTDATDTGVFEAIERSGHPESFPWQYAEAFGWSHQNTTFNTSGLVSSDPGTWIGYVYYANGAWREYRPN